MARLNNSIELCSRPQVNDARSCNQYTEPAEDTSNTTRYIAPLPQLWTTTQSTSEGSTSSFQKISRELNDNDDDSDVPIRRPRLRRWRCIDQEYGSPGTSSKVVDVDKLSTFQLALDNQDQRHGSDHDQELMTSKTKSQIAIGCLAVKRNSDIDRRCDSESDGGSAWDSDSDDLSDFIVSDCESLSEKYAQSNDKSVDLATSTSINIPDIVDNSDQAGKENPLDGSFDFLSSTLSYSPERQASPIKRMNKCYELDAVQRPSNHLSFSQLAAQHALRPIEGTAVDSPNAKNVYVTSPDSNSVKTFTIGTFCARPGDAAKTKRVKSLFRRERNAIATSFLQDIDGKVNDNRLTRMTDETGGIRIVWTKKFATTAGRADWRKETSRQGTSVSFKHHATIELSEKVITDETRLLNVIAHEYCHLANFMISGIQDKPHGSSFKSWAAKVSHMYSHRGIQVTTSHNYDINYKYIWRCGNTDCGTEYQRHSKSIDIEKQCCGRCTTRLVQIKPEAQIIRGEKSPQRHAYQEFVKSNYGRVKKEKPELQFGEIMKSLGQLYRERRQDCDKHVKPFACGSDIMLSSELDQTEQLFQTMAIS